MSIHAIVEELNDIEDVNVPVLTDGYVLYWDSAAGKFQLKAGVGGYTEGARAYHSANQAIATNTITILALDSERYDTDTIHDLVTNNSRLTCKTAGKYLIVAQVTFATHATGYRSISIRLNGSDLIGYNLADAVPADWTSFATSTIYDLSVDDYVELRIFHTAGENIDVLSNAQYSPEFMMQRIG